MEPGEKLNTDLDRFDPEKLRADWIELGHSLAGPDYEALYTEAKRLAARIKGLEEKLRLTQTMLSEASLECIEYRARLQKADELAGLLYERRRGYAYIDREREALAAYRGSDTEGAGE